MIFNINDKVQFFDWSDERQPWRFGYIAKKVGPFVLVREYKTTSWCTFDSSVLKGYQLKLTKSLRRIC